MAETVEAKWFVANLPYGAVKADFVRFLEQTLSPHGVTFEPKDLRLIRENDERKLKGFGFLTVQVPVGRDPDEVLELICGAEFDGRPIDFQRQRSDTPSPLGSRSRVAL